MSSRNLYDTLRPWLERFKAKIGEAGESWTHTSLAGGKWDIESLKHYLKPNTNKIRPELADMTPAEILARKRKQEDLFLKNYGRTTMVILFYKEKLKLGDEPHLIQCLNFISEGITPVFKYFIDFDFASANLDLAEGFSSETQLIRRIGKIEAKLKQYVPSKEIRKVIEKKENKLDLARETLKGLNHQKLLTLVRLVQSTLKDFYPGILKRDARVFTVLICLTTPKYSKDTCGEGVHLIFPYLEVDSEQALNIRETMVYRLEESEDFPERPNESCWRKVFDEGVYGQAGGALRMLGSRKAMKCKKKCTRGEITNEAKPGTKKVCECRYASGYTWNSRVYWPEYMLDSNGGLMVEELKSLLDPTVFIPSISPNKPPRPDNFFRLMKMASLRTHSAKPTTEFRMPAGAIHYVPMKFTSGGKPKKSQVPGGEREHDEDIKTISAFKNKQLFSSDHIYVSLFQKLIAHKFGDAYNRTRISKMFFIPSKEFEMHGMILICVSGPGSNFCLNVNKDHQHNTVYFMLDQKGIRQKCHCKCDVMRPSGVMCKNYSSESKTLRDVPLLWQNVFPPLYHGEAWVGDPNEKWGNMPPGFTYVYWNRITWLKPYDDDFDDGIKKTGIANDIDILSPEDVALIEQQISGCDPNALEPVPEEQVHESELQPNYQPKPKSKSKFKPDPPLKIRSDYSQPAQIL